MRIRSLIALLFLSAACVHAQFDLPTHRIVPNAAGTRGEIRFVEETGYLAGATGNYVAVKGPADIAANISLTLPGTLPGSTLCIAVDTSGVMSYSACSGGGSLTVQESDTSPSVSSVTTLNFNQAQGFTVTSGGAGIATVGFTGGVPPFVDTTSIIEGSGDVTKELRFEVDGFTTATTRVLTPQNASYTIAGTNLAQTFSALQSFSSGLEMASNLSMSTDGTWDIGSLTERVQNGYAEAWNADELQLSNNAGSDHWKIQRLADTTQVDFQDAGGEVEMSVADEYGIIMPDSSGSNGLWWGYGGNNGIYYSGTTNNAILIGPVETGIAGYVELRARKTSATDTLQFYYPTSGNVTLRPGDGLSVIDLGQTGRPFENVYLNEGANIYFLDSGTAINALTSSNGDLIVGADAAPASNSVAFTTSLYATARSAGGTAYTTSLLLEQQIDSNIVFRPTETNTFLGNSSFPWDTGYFDDLVVNDGATIDFGSGDADMSSANVYMRNIAASTGLSCGSVADGFMVTSDDGYIAICLGGTRYRVAVASGW